MRKNVLALSIATMIGGLGLTGAAIGSVINGTGAVTTNTLGATTASVLQVAPGGIGHILVVPYFTAQNGNSTVISLVNTDPSNGKAVKIRFRGASNSDDILDFTILMSPGDMWQGTVESVGGATARLYTADRTCTIPQLQPNVPQSFITTRLDPTPATNVADNTREGYVEIFNMADIPGPATLGSTSALYTATKHVGGVPPCTTTTQGAAAINALLTDTAVEATAAGMGLATPTTGLMGNWTIINVPNTTTFTGSATAVRALSNTTGVGTDGRGNYVLFPQSENNTNGNGVVGPIDNFTADPLFRTTANGTTKTAGGVLTGAPGSSIIAAQYYDMPDLSTPYIIDNGLTAAIATASTGNDIGPRAQASILTTALAVTSILNEYALEPTVTARTDWVFSMPTRRYSAALRYGPGTAVTPYFTNVPIDDLANNGTATAQFFYSTQTIVGIGAGTTRQLCVLSSSNSFTDREEGSNPGGGVFSPQQGSASASFCGETSVVTFGPSGTDSVLGSSVAKQFFAPAFVNGWGTFGTVAQTGVGLPVLGSSFIRLRNPAATAGTSGTYGIVFDHRYSRVNAP